MKKKLGIVAVGESETSDPEYRLISEQFHCIAAYLGWEIVLDESIRACAIDDLANDTEKLTQLAELSSKL